MIKHIRWQILLVLVGVALLVALLVYVALNFSTVWVAGRGGTYVEGLAGTPQFINPLLCQTYEVDGDLCALVFNGLTRMGYNGQVEPDLAERWEVSSDGLTYTFFLRPGVRWHDGTFFSADDVLFTIKLIQDPNFPGPPDWGELWRTVTATKIDDRTVQFELAQPFPAFLDYTTVGIVPRHQLENVPAAELVNAPFNIKPVGTGIYSISQVVTDTGRISHIILNANPFYFGQRPLIGRIQFKFYPNYQAVYQAYLRDEVQGIGRVAPEDLAAARQNENLQLFTSGLPRYSMIYLNNASDTAPFLGEKEIRQALMYALDRQALIDNVLDGQGIVAESPILNSSWAFTPTLRMYRYDPEKAISLLQEAGWQPSGDIASTSITSTDIVTPLVTAWFKDNRALSFSLLVPDDPTRIAIAEEIVRQWGLVGIQANVEPVVTGFLNERIQPRHYQAALVELDLTQVGDPDPYPFWHQTQIEPPGQNYANYDDRDMSEVLETARLTPNQQERKLLYDQFQRFFARDLPSIPLYQPVYTYAVDRSVRGVHVGPIVRPGDRFLGIADWYVRLRRVIRSVTGDERVESTAP